MRSRTTTRRSRVRRGCLLALAAAAVLPPGVEAQSSAPAVPFAVGEELTFQARSSRFGSLGTGVMSVEGGETVRGRRTYLLSFRFRGRVGPAVVEDRTRSWFDPRGLASLRYEKHERSPLSSRTEEVEMYPAARRWEAADGTVGGSVTDAPLDELSFLYFLRTLPLADGDAYSLDRHFDPRRNPVRVRVVGRSRLSVPAGEFSTVEVEMRVKDPDRYGGEGVIRMFLTDDARRIPVRIVSSMPVVGSVTLSLRSVPERTGGTAGIAIGGGAVSRPGTSSP